MTNKKIRLLIVDDEVKFLDAIALRLEMRGLDVTKTSNGHDALDVANHKRFDLALLDLKMPGMDGQQVLEVLKREHRFLEVIILTGHGSMDSAVECTKLGAYGYLPKPYEIEDLIEILKEAYQRRMEKKYAHDEVRLDELLAAAIGQSPLGILRRMRELDDEEK